MTVEISRLNDRTEQLAKHAAELAERLQPILRSVGPTACPPESKTEMSTPLVDRIRDINSQLENTISTLRSILDRCEV